jgi:hypothetical protein
VLGSGRRVRRGNVEIDRIDPARRLDVKAHEASPANADVDSRLQDSGPLAHQRAELDTRASAK